MIIFMHQIGLNERGMHAQNFGQNIMFLFYCSQCLRDAYLMINQYFSVRRRDISIIQSLQLFVI